MDHSIFEQDFLTIDTSLFFKFLMENAQSTCFLVLNTDGIILSCNAGFQKHFGYSIEELRGKHLKVTFIPSDRLKKLPEIEVEQVMQKGYGHDNNYLLHKDGTYIWAHGESVFVKDGKGTPYIVKVLYDINQQKLLENHLKDSQQELKNRLDELHQLNEELDTFVYAASHDLKAPISNVEALVHTLHEDLSVESKKTASEILNMIEVSIDKLRTTIGDLAKTAKSKFKKENEKEKVQFAQILGEVKVNLLKQLKESKAEIKEDFSKVPTVYFSGKNLRSILFNLISNAIKYRSPERKPEINLSTEKDEKFVILKVSDNGMGIKEEDKDKVFELYSRIYTHVEGTGIGMSIVAKMLRNCGGKIEIESKEGKGSLFKVYIPQ